MSDYLKRTWAQVDLDKIVHNFQAIRSYIRPGCKIMAVVKADAYGHGVKFVAKELEASGADCFAVSNVEEAIQLRTEGIHEPVLILGFTPPSCAKDLIRHRLTQTVFSEEYAQALSDGAEKENGKITVHIKADTGMGRIGFRFDENSPNTESVEAIRRVSGLKGLVLEGIFTHFAVSDEPEKGFTRTQFRIFTDAIEKLHENGVNFAVHHCCNSAALLYFPEMQLDMVRPGIILYGLRPDAAREVPIDIRPAMELKTVISQIKTLGPGVSVSYGRKYVTQKETKIATLPVGYADGFTRNLSNSADVLICGKRARIVGRVCMDQCMADVTGIEHPERCGEVTIVGRDGDEEITMDEFASKMGTINYETACLVGKRVPRVFLKDGKSAGFIDLILS